MPVYFDIHSSTGDYQIVVGGDLLSGVLKEHTDAVILIDASLAHILPESAKNIICVAATEDNKSLEQAAPIIAQLRKLGANRHTHLLAIGGGIIQDIATFCASIYMRGIPWTYLPTTLLGMVDSCIGGKSSINVSGYKNLVGNFYPPVDVVIDLEFLKTLNNDAVIGGLCEAAKICYVRSFDEFQAYLSDTPSIKLNTTQAEHIVTRSLRAKQWFIEVDEFDKKERLLLNFGHTFGHALEAGTEFRISHGVAVGVGMVVAEEFARYRGLMSKLGHQHTACLSNHITSLLKQLPSLKKELECINLDLVIEKFENDKKHYSDRYQIVVPQNSGDLILFSVSRSDAARAEIRASYEAAIKRLCT